VGKGKDLKDRELTALKRTQAWENRFNDNGEKDRNGRVLVEPNDHGPWHRKLNDTMFWL